MTALKILFDLLLIYGLEIVDASEGSSNESADNPSSMDGVTSETTSTSSDSRNGIASKLVAIICSFLDGEVSNRILYPGIELMIRIRCYNNSN